jgi:squalene-hopene/tetraprenyl-beta-curcumene cyclase
LKEFSMHRRLTTCICIALSLPFALASVLRAAEPVSLETATDPGANTPDESLGTFSFEKAVDFLDNVALTWQKDKKCFTCHTNYAYLYARPVAGRQASVAHTSVRQFAEELVEKRWQTEGPRWDAEVVATSAALAFNDAATTGKLHPMTLTALDRMWSLQREDGSWDWLKCDWPPMESDDPYGVTVAAIAVGVAPEGYAETELARTGMQRIRAYRKANPSPTMHHEAMWLWAASYTPDLMTEDEKQKCIDQLLGLQRPDGGWALATLGDWKREDGSPQDMETSDGYGTGFVTFVLRKAGVPADAPALQRAVNWLTSHQRTSGRWFTRSLHADSRHYITHAGTAFAVLALDACRAVKGGE